RRSGLGRVFTFEKSAVTNEWGRGNAPGPRLLPGHRFQQPETHLPLPSNSMVRSLIARWVDGLICFMSAAVWVFALSLPPSVAASFTCVKITEAGFSRSLMAYAPDWNRPGFGPRLITARFALWKSLMTVLMSTKA